MVLAVILLAISGFLVGFSGLLTIVFLAALVAGGRADRHD